MPIASLNELSPKQKALWERIYEEQRKKGKSEATSAKIAWGVVKEASKSKTNEKSYPVKQIINEKSMDGNMYLEGHILTFDPDFENEVMTKEFAEDILEDLKLGTFYHENDSLGLLEIVDKKVDDKGLFAKVKVNKDNKYYSEAVKLIQENPEKLGFSVRVSTDAFGKKIVEKDGKYFSAYVKGKGIDFGLTADPINTNAKAKPL